jgi:hypothetical protein
MQRDRRARLEGGPHDPLAVFDVQPQRLRMHAWGHRVSQHRVFVSFTVSSSRCGNSTNGSAAPLLVLAATGARLVDSVIGTSK